jgi:hypothetical protein
MEDKAIEQDEIAKRGLAADIGVHFAEGARTGIAIQAGNALDTVGIWPLWSVIRSGRL